MRDEFYADKRDLVKWSVLLQLADVHDATTILQVAYYRPTTWKRIEIDDQAYALPQAVTAHFRNIRNVTAMKSNARVQVFNHPFYHSNRAQYHRVVSTLLGSLPKGAAIVFLDPDTGLEPKGGAGPEHVRDDELRETWNALRPGDLLVFYQHANRNRRWIEEKRSQFEKALGLSPGGSKLAQGTQIAGDVAFFFSQRLDSAGTIQARK